METVAAQPSRSVRSPMPGLLIAQFVAAFNDNAFKMLVVLLGMAAVADADEAQRQAVAAMAFVCLTAPLLLGSLPAMAIGDRVSKRSLILWTKGLEVVLMAGGTAALAFDPAGPWPVVVLAGMGLQSALFAPGKYGILPETLPHEQLSAANGKLEAMSFLAIVLGTALGGLMLEHSGGRPWLVGAFLTTLSALSLWAARTLPHTPAAGGKEPVLRSMRRACADLRQDRALWLAAVGLTAFWAIASLLGQDLLVYGKEQLGFSDSLAAAPYALFAIGVGIGSLLVGRLSAGKVELGFVPIGAFGVAAAISAMGLSEPGRLGAFSCMAALGLASGFLVVPLQAYIQWRAPAARRGALLALVNLVCYAGMIVGNFSCLWLARLGLDCGEILAAAAATAAVGAVVALWLLPEAMLRLIALLVTRLFFRVRAVGARHVPQAGGVLLAPNHVSFVDGLLLASATDRRIRFLVDRTWCERPLLGRFLRAVGAIPIDGGDGPKSVLRALRLAGEALERGEAVCIFAEGEISRMGSTLPFRGGLARLAKASGAPIVPVHLDRVYGGFGSAQQGRLRLWPKRLSARITVSFGAPLHDADPAKVRSSVEGLGERAASARAAGSEPVHAELVRQARRRPWRASLSDGPQTKLSRIAVVCAAVALARRLRGRLQGEPRIGLLLPPSVGGGIALLALSLAGRVAVPLNFTAGKAAMESAVRQAGLRTAIVSKAMLAQWSGELPAGVEAIALEDCLPRTSFGERAVALWLALFASRARLERACGAEEPVRGGDIAATLFSSGSGGEPKGVELRHRNLASNCDAASQVLPFAQGDTLLSALPLFHSFGVFAFWCALRQGAAVAFRPNPLDADSIGRAAQIHRATVLIATPTFLQMYLRRCEPGQFGSLRIVLTGAEKLTDALADAFEERFGVRPVQGYGATECAPVIAVSAPGYRAPGLRQAGHRRGSVGRPLPGVAVRIVEPATMQPLPIGASGLVLVRGPNVMRGYLGRPDLTAQAMCGGFYVTGDIGRLDEDGFLFLEGRLSRFSKIGGEMVPHGLVEEALQECSGVQERAFAVCGLPDESKGERLAVLTTLPPDLATAALDGLSARGLPPLFVPKKAALVRVEALPLLGSGKLDLQRVRQLAESALGGARANGTPA